MKFQNLAIFQVQCQCLSPGAPSVASSHRLATTVTQRKWLLGNICHPYNCLYLWAASTWPLNFFLQRVCKSNERSWFLYGRGHDPEYIYEGKLCAKPGVFSCQLNTDLWYQWRIELSLFSVDSVHLFPFIPLFLKKSNMTEWGHCCLLLKMRKSCNLLVLWCVTGMSWYTLTIQQ